MIFINISTSTSLAVSFDIFISTGTNNTREICYTSRFVRGALFSVRITLRVSFLWTVFLPELRYGQTVHLVCLPAGNNIQITFVEKPRLRRQWCLRRFFHACVKGIEAHALRAHRGAELPSVGSFSRSGQLFCQSYTLDNYSVREKLTRTQIGQKSCPELRSD